MAQRVAVAQRRAVAVAQREPLLHEGAVLARAAVAAGVSGVFMETHPDPAKAKCDGPNAWPLSAMRELMTQLQAIDRVVKSRPFAESALLTP